MNTTTCATCGNTTHTDSPWNTTVVWCNQCVTRLHATRKEILRLKALQSEGRLLAGMGVRPWERERGAKTAERATTALIDLFGGLTAEDMEYIRDLETVAA